MLTITIERNGYFSHTRYLFYKLSEVKAIAREIFCTSDVNFVTVQSKSGKVHLSLVK